MQSVSLVEPVQNGLHKVSWGQVPSRMSCDIKGVDKEFKEKRGKLEHGRKHTHGQQSSGE